VIVDAGGRDVRVSSPAREVFPGVTKLEVVEYYIGVAEPMLRQVGGRPTALERWPEGVADGRESFFQKHLPKAVPDYVAGADVRFPSGRPGRLLCPASAASLAWAAQMGAITFHAWPVRVPHTEHPDQIRIDLDPADGMSFDDVRHAAVLAREVLLECSLVPFVKTSGSRGLHVFAPLDADHGFVDVRHAAIAVGREMERRAPDLITMSWWKEERGTRIFVDFNQNAQDRLMASAYSLRPRPEATVSMPVEWDDISAVSPADFTLRTAPGHIAARARDPWGDMGESSASLVVALGWWERDLADGLGELPYPPDFPKMPGEPPRVQPSRARQASAD
jgi:DNA ligase D